MAYKVSIIVPCKGIDDLTKQCIRECLKLDYEDFEIIILPDEVKTPYKIKNNKLKIITTGEIVPSEKRNLGMEKASGDFYAFIDSDAYPRKDWLTNVINYFKRDKDHKIGIVGGPNVTPPEANFAERVSGHVLGNPLISGHAAQRYVVGKKNNYVMELPSCNYVVRKQAASKYDSRFLTAEDTLFCLRARKKGFKVLYARDVLVYHHRRNTLKKHLKQMIIYGRDNLWLYKEEPSKDKFYFLITMLGVVGFLAGIGLSLFFPLIRVIFSSIVGIYVLAILITSIHDNLKITLIVFFISVISHFMHGFGSFYGLFSKRRRVFNER